MRKVTLPYKILTIFGLIVGVACVIGTYIWIHPVERFTASAQIILSKSGYGLEAGSPVCYLGRPVGRIKSVALDQDQVKIDLVFYQKFTINQSTHAALEISDFQFRRQVMIYTPRLNDPPMDSNILPVYESSAMDNIPEEVLKLIRRVENVLTEIEEILRGTKAEISGVLNKAGKTAEEVNRVAAQTLKMLKKMQKTRIGRWLVG